MASFELAVSRILKEEGGYVNDPKDKGGETKYGISKRAYPNEDIKNLTVERAKEIYRRDYWNPIKGDQIPAQSVAESVFDMAVNGGTGTALKLAKSALEGIGGASLATVGTAQDKFNALFGKLRIAYYRGIVAKNPSQEKFLKAWEARANRFFKAMPTNSALVVGSLALGAVWLMRKRIFKQRA